MNDKTSPPVPMSTRQNVAYSLLDYISVPLLLAVAAPILLRKLGAADFGAWLLINAITAGVSGLGGGFGDAAIHYISMYRARQDRQGVVRSLSASLVVNSILGLGFSLLVIASASYLIHVFKVQPELRESCIVALRIAAVLILVRLVESVLIGAVRAHEIYRPVVLVSVATRAVVIIAILLLVTQGFRLVAILWATLVGGIFSTYCQAWIAFRVAGGIVAPAREVAAGIREIGGFGTYAWLKSVAGVAFGYGDRLLVGAVLGTAPLAFYGLCNQITQPIHALIAAAYNYVFPNLGVRAGANQWQQLHRNYRLAAFVSCAVIAGICLPLALASRWLLTLWLGAAAAQQSTTLLVLLTLGNGLLAACVVPHYAALAVGRARALAYINFAAGGAALTLGYWSMRLLGLNGAGFIRIASGIVSLSVYLVVRHSLHPRLCSIESSRVDDRTSAPVATSKQLQTIPQSLADC